MLQVHAACCVLQLTPQTVAAAAASSGCDAAAATASGGDSAAAAEAADAERRMVRNFLKRARTIAVREAQRRAEAAPPVDTWKPRRQLQEAVAEAARDDGCEVLRRVRSPGQHASRMHAHMRPGTGRLLASGQSIAPCSCKLKAESGTDALHAVHAWLFLSAFMTDR